MSASTSTRAAIVALAISALVLPVPAGAAVTKERLQNGLTVLVRENPAAPVVAVSVFVRVGSRWETDETAGITNLLQHVMLKGAAGRSALATALAAERLGGNISASAEPDFAEVRGTALARNWRGLLELLADVVLRPTLDAEEIERERRVVLAAIRNRQDQPFPAALDALLAHLYGRHPYGLPTAGHALAVGRLDRAALAAHFARYYRAGRIIVSVSGDVPATEVRAEVRRLFAAAVEGDGGPDAAPPSPAPSRDHTVIARAASQVQVLIGFLAPPAEHPDYAAMKVLSTVLGGGMAGRLFTELRDKEGLAYATGASYPTRAGPGFLLGQIGTAPANAARAEAGIRREIERLRRELLSERELQRAKAYLLGQFTLDRRTNARLAWYAAFFEAAGVGHDFAERYPRQVEQVTAADVLRVADLYLGTPTVVILGPSR